MSDILRVSGIIQYVHDIRKRIMLDASESVLSNKNRNSIVNGYIALNEVERTRKQPGQSSPSA
jgi:hypothetical protein